MRDGKKLSTISQQPMPFRCEDKLRKIEESLRKYYPVELETMSALKLYQALTELFFYGDYEFVSRICDAWLSKDEYDGIDLFCLCQHFATWYEAIRKGNPLDFAEPCAMCRNREDCRKKSFPWQEKILPILESQGVKIKLAHLER